MRKSWRSCMKVKLLGILLFFNRWKVLISNCSLLWKFNFSSIFWFIYFFYYVCTYRPSFSKNPKYEKITKPGKFQLSIWQLTSFLFFGWWKPFLVCVHCTVQYSWFLSPPPLWTSVLLSPLSTASHRGYSSLPPKGRGKFLGAFVWNFSFFSILFYLS